MLEQSTRKQDWSREATGKKKRDYEKVMTHLKKFQQGEITAQALRDFVSHKLRPDSSCHLTSLLSFDDLTTVEHREMTAVCAEISHSVALSDAGLTHELTESVLKMQILMAALTQNVEQLMDAAATLAKYLQQIFSAAKPDEQDKILRRLAILNLGAEIACLPVFQDFIGQVSYRPSCVDTDAIRVEETSSWIDLPCEPK